MDVIIILSQKNMDGKNNKKMKQQVEDKKSCKETTSTASFKTNTIATLNEEKKKTIIHQQQDLSHCMAMATIMFTSKYTSSKVVVGGCSKDRDDNKDETEDT